MHARARRAARSPPIVEHDAPDLPDPDMVPIFARMAALAPGRPPSHLIGTRAFRERMEADARARAGTAPPMAVVTDVTIPGGVRGTVPARLYRPNVVDGTPRPALAYLHGSGWVGGSLESHDHVARWLASLAGTTVIAIDHVLAPEHPFPAPIEDCAAAIGWLRSDASAALGLDGARLGVVGDSAGGNLALASALALRDAGRPLPRVIASNYGVLTADLDTPSHRAFGDGRFGLSTAAMAWYWAQYAGADPAVRMHPWACPVAADPRGLPPVVLAGAGLDPLRDDSRRCAAAFAAAGHEVDFAEDRGLPHGHLHHAAAVPAARRSLARVARACVARLVDAG
ncbi:MAG: hypothetical protein RJA99_1095 [Pseudomonadota bacterium]|jgi:acetyl esterase